MSGRRRIAVGAGVGLAALACIAALSACGGGAPEVEANPLEESMTSGVGEALRRLTSGENGLEVRKWIVADDSSAFATALGAAATGAPFDDELEERLRRNGLRLVRVDVDALDGIEERLGGTTYDLTAWYGQAVQWQNLMRHNLDQGRAVAIDGHVRRFGRGSFRLMLRGWSLQMEDGPYVHLEVMPEFHPPESHDLRDLLQVEGDFEGERFETLELRLEMTGGYAYLLTAERPGLAWVPDRVATPDADQAATPPPAGRSTRRTMGPLDSVGPDAATPPTLGELLFKGGGAQPSRGVVVFVPRVSRDLYPPGHPALAVQSP